MSITDFLDILHNKSKNWCDLSEQEKKEFSPYMINRWLSMEPEYCELVSDLQKYTVGVLNKELVFKLYLDLLPKRKKFYLKYIKGDKKDKYESETISILKEYLQESKKNILQLMLLLENSTLLVNILSKFGKSEKEINKLIKIKN